MALSFVLAPVLPIASAFLIIDGLHHLNGSQTWLQTGINNFKEWLIDKLRPDMATQEQNEQIPTIQGGKNQSGANQPIPLVLGETYYTPLYIGTPYSTIDTSKHNNGETEYFTALYCLGQSDIEVRDFELGIYTIASNESNITSGVIPIDESSVYPQSSYDTQLEIQNGNTEVSLYNQKVVQESLNAQLLNVDGQERLVVRTFSARYPQKVRLEVQFQSLVKYSDDDGEKEDDSVEIGFAYSIDNVNNDGTFNALHQMGDWGNNNDVAITFEGDHVYKNTTYAVYKFTAKQNKQMRFALDFNLSWEQACTSVAFGGSVVEFAICRFNVENTNTNYQDKCYFTRITTWCYDYKKSTETSSFVAQSPLVERFRNLTTRVGFKIKAGDELNGTLNAFNCIVKAKGRTYDPSTETWSNNTVVTSNPASMALMCMQSQLRGKYTYEDSKLDLYSFGQLYTRCEQIDSELNAPRYTVNGVVNTQKKTSELIQSILNCANSYLVLKGTKYGIFVDEPQYNPVMVLNNQNVLEANNSKSFDETTHAIKVKFVNAINYYKQDTMLCVANNYLNMDESDMNILETEFLYYTNPKRVYRKAMRLLAEKKLRPEVWNRKVGIEGNLIEIGNLVELQDDTISVGIGNGAEITEVITDSSNNIIGIHTDGEFDVVDSVGKSYAVKITQADGVHKPTVQTFVININGDDTYSNFTFATPISASAYIKPCVGDIVTFGIFTKESVQALCFGKKDNGDGTFNLTFVPYDEGVYESESGDIPEFNSNVTPPKQNGVAIDENEQNKYLEIILKNKEKGLDGYTLYSEGTSIVLNATSDGTIEETVFPCKINFMQGTDNVYFEFGNIVLPNGVSYYIDNTTVNLIFAQGNSLLDKGVIEIPIRYSKLEDNVLFVTPNGDTFGYGGTQFGYHILDPNKSEFIVKVSYAKSKQGESINIVSSTNYYQVSTSRSNVPTGTWSTSIPSMSDNQYLWTKTVVLYSDGNEVESFTCSGARGLQGENGADGADGAQGQRGAEYFGTEVPTNPVEGDFYLKLSDGYLYYYHLSEWTRILSYSDPRYITAMNDMINNISSTKPVGFQTLVNGWVENLTANTALINKLFAKQITLQSGGEIKSSNWSQGFKLSDDGTVEFYKGSIGESVEIGRTHICSSNQGLVICKGNVTYEKIKNIIIGNANADGFGDDAQRNIIITNYFSILQNATDNVLIGHTVYATNRQHKNVVIGNNNNLGSNNEVEENILIGYNLNPNWGYKWKHNINLGNRFVYYEFDSTATHDTVYSELGRILSVSRNDSFLITCIASSSLTVTIQPPQSSSYSVLVSINTIRKDAGSSILYLGQYSTSDDYRYKIYGGNSTQLGGNLRIALLPDTDAYTITNH